MPRGSSGRSSGGGYRPSRPAAARRSPPQAAKPAPPPATAQPTSGGGSIFSSIGSSIADGMAFGIGNSFAHRIADSLFGVRTINVETVDSQAAPASPVANSTSACDIQSKAFQDCVNNFGSDISNCQSYMNMLSECKKKNAGSGWTGYAIN